VDELIATVGLTEQAGQRVRRLSGGQRRRLDVAIGIVGRPELLFLDEPTAGFDPEARLAAYFEVPVEVIFSTEPFPRIGSAGMSVS
jgi:ABC-type multidrug transport system ATPase subunit